MGVSVDDRGAGETIQSFLQEVGVAFPIYHDPSSEIMDAYGLLGLPGSFLVDAEGVLVRKWVGSFHPMNPDVQESVRALLPSQAATQADRTRGDSLGSSPATWDWCRRWRSARAP